MTRRSNILLFSIIVLAVGIMVMAGWLLKIRLLLNIIPHAPTMKFNTALLFSLSGLGTLLSVSKERKNEIFIYSAGILITAISFITLIQYFGLSNFDIDNLIYKDVSNIPFPGRMARTTAICFILFGITLITNRQPSAFGRKFTKAALSLIALIAILVILTFFLQAVTEEKVLIFNTMAFHTAICFFLLSMGLSLCNPRNTYIDLFSGSELGSRLARKLLPFLVFLPLGLSFFFLIVIDSNFINTEYGVAVYTLFYAVVGLTYTSWMANKLNKEDIERKELEKNLYHTNADLKETVQFKRQLVRTTPETIVIINLNELKIRYVNADIYPEKGLDKESIEGTPIENVLPYIHPRDREKVIDLHKKLLKSKDDDIHDIEIRLNLKKNEDWEWFSIRGKIFQRRDEAWIEEYVLLVRNINKLKTTQKALINAERYSIQGEIARTLGHELRNPLASIGMATEVLNQKIDKEQKEPLKNYLDILSRSTKRLNKLVSDLLNVSNYSPTVFKNQSLSAIVESSIEKASDRIYLAGIDLKRNYQGKFLIKADKEKLEIAILNLLVNASEATPPENGIIEIGIQENNSCYILSIRDNGRGIEKEEMATLFDAFYTNKKTGAGIGLNSVKNILEEHDAKIEVCSKPEQGATFKIYFHKIEE